MSKKEPPPAERIEAIDVSAVDGLARVRREREVVEGRLEALEERREKVSQAVYERVRGDYRDRLSELEQEAEPLSREARREYAKLDALRREVEEAEERDRLDKEEVELRHELGELDKKGFEARLAECEGRLEERRTEREKVEKLRSRFLEAVRSEEELLEPVAGEEPAAEEAPMPPADEPPEAVAAAEEGSQELPPAEAGAASASLDQAEAEAAPGELDAGEEGGPPPGATVLLPLPGAAGEASEGEWYDAPTGLVPSAPGAPVEGSIAEPSAGAEDLAGATRILSRPRLVLLDGEEPTESYFLGPQPAIIGRAAGIAIQVLEEAISRRHAEIKPGPEGFVLHDLGSENGTYVNGERIATHTLREGDVVQVGPRRLVFHEV
jgi:hypothetical protein